MEVKYSLFGKILRARMALVAMEAGYYWQPLYDRLKENVRAPRKLSKGG